MKFIKDLFTMVKNLYYIEKAIKYEEYTMRNRRDMGKLLYEIEQRVERKRNKG